MRDYKHKQSREPWGRAWLLALVILVIMLAGACTAAPRGPAFDDCEHDRATCYTAGSDYNEAGGYADACGDLPGLIGDLTYLIDRVLGGELSTRFVLKVLTVGTIAGTAFWYYLSDLRRDEKEGRA